ncbi:MAG TPA: hypothetical protein VE974_23015 [Thermoanaerobaculia bacterium]|nr:hypothetical protein [Thermoanaerobaculia bacterium]
MRPALGLCFAFLLAAGVEAQTGVVLELEDVVDNRVSSADPGGFQVQGGLELRVKVNGSGMDKVTAARVIVREAKDDKGTSLVSKPNVPDFYPREYNNGTLQVAVGQPARNATSVRMKGTIELYVPSRDPGASVKIANALATLDKPLSAKALKAAKLEITPLSREGYAAAAKARKITEKDIEQLRAEGKKQGAPEKEIELAVALAQAFEGMDDDVSDTAVILSGETSDFDRIYRIEVLGEDGEPIHMTSRGTSSRGESSLMTLNPAQPLPANATLQLMLLTDKTRVSVPFDLKVPLP